MKSSLRSFGSLSKGLFFVRPGFLKVSQLAYQRSERSRKDEVLCRHAVLAGWRVILRIGQESCWLSSGTQGFDLSGPPHCLQVHLLDQVLDLDFHLHAGQT